MGTEQQITELVGRWASGERANDSAAIEPLLAEDFRGIGPWGFVLNRTQWLARFAGEVFRHSEFAIDDIEVRSFGETAVVIAIQTQKATHDGQPSDGTFRISQVWVDTEDGWRMAHNQLSFTAAAMPQE